MCVCVVRLIGTNLLNHNHKPIFFSLTIFTSRSHCEKQRSTSKGKQIMIYAKRQMKKKKNNIITASEWFSVALLALSIVKACNSSQLASMHPLFKWDRTVSNARQMNVSELQSVHTLFYDDSCRDHLVCMSHRTIQWTQHKLLPFHSATNCVSSYFFPLCLFLIWDGRFSTR